MGSQRAKLITRCCYAAVTLVAVSVMFWIAWCLFGLTAVQVSDAQRRALVQYSATKSPTTPAPPRTASTTLAPEETSSNSISKLPTTASLEEKKHIFKPNASSGNNHGVVSAPSDKALDSKSSGSQEDHIHARRVLASGSENRPEDEKTGRKPPTTPRYDIVPTRVHEAERSADEKARTGPTELPRGDDIQSSRHPEPESKYRDPDFSREDQPRRRVLTSDQDRYDEDRDDVRRSTRVRNDGRGRDTDDRYSKGDTRVYPEDRRPAEERYPEDRARKGDYDERYYDKPRYRDDERYRPRADDRYRDRDDGRHSHRDDERYRTSDDDRVRVQDDDGYRSRNDERYRTRGEERYRPKDDDRYKHRDEEVYRLADEDKRRSLDEEEEKRYRARQDERYKYRDEEVYRLADEGKRRSMDEEEEKRYRARQDERYKYRDEELYRLADEGKRRSMDEEEEKRYRAREDDRRRLRDNERYREDGVDRKDTSKRFNDDEVRYRPRTDVDASAPETTVDKGTPSRSGSVLPAGERKPTSSRYEYNLKSEETVTDYDRPVRERPREPRPPYEERIRERGREDEIRRPSRYENDRTNISPTRTREESSPSRSRGSGDDPRYVDRPRADDRRYDEDRTRIQDSRSSLSPGESSRRYDDDRDRYPTRLTDEKTDRRDEVVLDQRSYASEDEEYRRKDSRRGDYDRDRRPVDDARSYSRPDPIDDDEYRRRRPSDYDTDRVRSRDRYEDDYRRYDDRIPAKEDRLPPLPVRRYDPYSDDDDMKTRRKDPDPRTEGSSRRGLSSRNEEKSYSRDEYVDSQSPSRRRYDADVSGSRDPYPEGQRSSYSSRRDPMPGSSLSVVVREKRFQSTEDPRQRDDPGRPRSPVRPLSPKDVIEDVSKQSDASVWDSRGVPYPVYDPRSSNLTSTDIIPPKDRRGTTVTLRKRRSD